MDSNLVHYTYHGENDSTVCVVIRKNNCSNTSFSCNPTSMLRRPEQERKLKIFREENYNHISRFLEPLNVVVFFSSAYYYFVITIVAL